jgi:adenylate cyclase
VGTLTSVTRVARMEQRRNEEMVLSESAIAGERRVAWVRLLMVSMFAITSALISPMLGYSPAHSPGRLAVVGVYVAFTIGAIVRLRTVAPDPRKSFIIPLVITVIDFGFLSTMAMLDELERGRVWPEMGAVAFALVLCFSVARSSWIHVAWSALLACASYAAIGVATHNIDGVSTPFVLGGFAALGALIGLTNRAVRSMFTGLRRRDNLTRFLPRAIAERVLAGGAEALAPIQREVTVLFSDIRDFTALSEALAPRQVLEFLDEYFGTMSQIVKGHDGVVNKFIGDGMLAFWGVPDLNPDHAREAVRAALDMRLALVELNEDRERRGLAPVRIGIGIHTGPVAAGMLGGADQHEYTVIGDAVNVASRIEGLTKGLGADILVSESTWTLLDGKFPGARASEETIRGRKGVVVVYTLGTP